MVSKNEQMWLERVTRNLPKKGEEVKKEEPKTEVVSEETKPVVEDKKEEVITEDKNRRKADGQRRIEKRVKRGPVRLIGKTKKEEAETNDNVIDEPTHSTDEGIIEQLVNQYLEQNPEATEDEIVAAVEAAINEQPVTEETEVEEEEINLLTEIVAAAVSDAPDDFMTQFDAAMQVHLQQMVGDRKLTLQKELLGIEDEFVPDQEDEVEDETPEEEIEDGEELTSDIEE